MRMDRRDGEAICLYPTEEILNEFATTFSETGPIVINQSEKIRSTAQPKHGTALQDNSSSLNAFCSFQLI